MGIESSGRVSVIGAEQTPPNAGENGGDGWGPRARPSGESFVEGTSFWGKAGEIFTSLHSNSPAADPKYPGHRVSSWNLFKQDHGSPADMLLGKTTKVYDPTGAGPGKPPSHGDARQFPGYFETVFNLFLGKR